MDSTIAIAVLGTLTTVSVAVVSVVVSNWKEQIAKARQRKIDLYDNLIKSMTSVMTDGSKESQAKFANAYNTAVLVAPPDVYHALRVCFHESGSSVSFRSPQFKQLMLAIRRDIGIRPKDDEAVFEPHFLGLGVIVTTTEKAEVESPPEGS